MANSVFPIGVAVVLVTLLVLLTDPFMLWMPPMAAMVVLVAAATLAVVWAGFVFNERGGDERNLANRMHAGRAAYLTGIGILTIALVVQGLAHTLDVWVVVALGAMVLVKLVVGMYAERYH